MKTIIGLCIAVVIALLVWVIKHNSIKEHFGEPFNNSPIAKVDDLIDRPSEYLGREVTVIGKISDQCPMTGCYFFFYRNGDRLRIELGDLAQTIPRRKGAEIQVEGKLEKLNDGYQLLGRAAEFK